MRLYNNCVREMRSKVAALLFAKRRIRQRKTARRALSAKHVHEKRRSEDKEGCVEDELDIPLSSSTEEGDEKGEEEEEEEGEAHLHLLTAISDLGCHRRHGQRSEDTPTVSEYQLTSHSDDVSIGGLLSGELEVGKGLSGLRRQLATTSTHQLSPPATKQEMEKAHRALAYSSACRDVGKWLPVVTHNRKAPHLSFPLQEEIVPVPSLTSRTEQFQAVTSLERAVMGVVVRSEDVIEATNDELTAGERAQLVRVMTEEGRERVRESRQWRRLMSQYEAKCHRERRIKSRGFHKMQRRRHAKASEGGEGVRGEEEEKAEKLRATERMTLRHSRHGKWAREVLARKKRDPAARSALNELTLRGRVLTQQQPVEEEEEMAESDSEAPPTELADHHDNPWLQSSAPVLLLNSEPSPEPAAQDDEDLDKRQSCDITSSVAKKVPHIDPTAYLTSQKEGVALGVASQQLLNVHEAFAGDDVVAQFAREKTAAAEESPTTLPGWGVWGGDGTKPNKKKLVKPDKSVKPRSDRELGHVIIGNYGNVKINKHLVKQLPWPFSSPQQFNRAQATPIGRNWNSEVIHRQMVTPHVETAVGVAIPPMKLTDDVKDFVKRHSHQDRKRRQGPLYHDI